jgi:hypothetical protein
LRIRAKLELARRQVPTTLGLALILLLEVIWIILLLFFAPRITQAVLQAIVFLISMVIIWYVSHPLTHFIFARSSNVSTLYFYVGHSEMGRGGSSQMKKVSKLLITIGTKLNGSKMAQIPVSRRAWIYGAAPLVGLVLVAIIESFAILYPKFNVLALVLGGLFFLLTLGTELTLGMKSGDLSKMKRELSKPK